VACATATCVLVQSLGGLRLIRPHPAYHSQQLGYTLPQLSCDRHDLRLRHHEHRIDIDDPVPGGRHLSSAVFKNTLRSGALPSAGRWVEKKVPISPAETAPSNASVIAWSSTSPSEWRRRAPRDGSIARPANHQRDTGLETRGNSNPSQFLALISREESYYHCESRQDKG